MSSETSAEGLRPGGPEARDEGCCCSVLANAGHRVDPGIAALIDPECPVHATDDGAGRA